MPKVFAVYYRGRHLKETSPNRLLLTPEKSLILKQYRSSTNNSDGIFSVQPPFGLRSTSVRAPFELRSSSVHPPFELRSTSVQPPFNLRSTSVQPPFVLRSFSVQSPFGDRRTNGESSKKYRKIIGGKTEMYRNSNEKPRERRPNKNFIFNHLNSNCYGKI